MARYDDLNTSAIAYTTVVGTVLLLLIILLGRALCYSWVEAEDDRKLRMSHYTLADQEIREQRSKLTGYQKVIPAPTTEPEAAAVGPKVMIPLEQAKQIILAELSAEPKT